ncbi:DUF397 domain-containing protein [Streptomyces sp. NPDC056269]|uniref:DUF397 domain-containing protein n=1 Tax=Streptomyces sp. NPDC056269 TaxID=3345768 RepID=UPI0035E00302
MTTTPSLMATDLPGAAWRKSSYSGGNEGQCIEAADMRTSHGGIAIRDSKNPAGPALLLPAGAFSTFIAAAATGEL